MSADVTPVRYLGRGWGFPVRPGIADGRLAVDEGTEKVRRSMLIILETEPGERIMNPAFGCPLRSYLQQPNSVATRALIARDVEAALRRWEPRIELAGVEVVPGDDPSEVLIGIAYRHVRDGRPGNLVFPFFLAAGGDA
jgi:phage baseplate assembly protein W